MALITSASITYLMDAGKEERDREILKWSSDLGLHTFNFLAFNGSRKTLLTWKEWSLPGDDKSNQNAIAITQMFKKV